MGGSSRFGAERVAHVALSGTWMGSPRTLSAFGLGEAT